MCAVEGIDYVYLETRDFDASVGFWRRLGFELVLDLGSAGRLVPSGGGPGVFLQEVSAETPLAQGVYLAAADDGVITEPPVEAVGPVVDTHWGTRLRVVRDPDGREFVVQFRPAEAGPPEG